MWPRHTGDFAFYRAYVGPDGKPAAFAADNVPYQPRHWLKIADKPLGPGDTLDIRIYQLSALVGRGAPKTLTLIL